MISRASALTAAKRWDECSKCEHLTSLTKQCKLCYCFMKLKIHVAGAKCADKPPRWKEEKKAK